VALCTFDGARHLQAQLDSLAAQQRPPDELVVQDDGSADGTLEILERFRRSAPFPVHVARNPARLGVARNFEAALRRTVGEVVLPCDQDDVWHPGKVVALVDALERTGADAAFCDARLVDEGGRPLGRTVWDASEFTGRARRRFSRDPVAVLLRRNRVTGMCLAIRRHALDWTLPIPPRWKHDHWMALVVAARGRLAPVPEALVDYRQHGRAVIGARPMSTRERILRGVGATAADQAAAAARLQELAARLQELRSGPDPPAPTLARGIARRARPCRPRGPADFRPCCGSRPPADTGGTTPGCGRRHGTFCGLDDPDDNALSAIPDGPACG
jgi:hypothetical protein